MGTLKIAALLGTFLAVAVLSPSVSFAFNEGNEAPNGEDPEFKQVLRERELERDRSRKNLEERERERKTREGKVRVHIHAPTDAPTSTDGSEVVARFELSKEELEKKDFSRVHAAARAQSRLGRVMGTAEAAAAPAPGSGGSSASDSPVPNNRTLLGLSLLLVAGGAWWVMRPRETV